MQTFYYTVVSIDGDYANLKRTDIESENIKLVARALLPEGINEGTNLKYDGISIFEKINILIKVLELMKSYLIKVLRVMKSSLIKM